MSREYDPKLDGPRKLKRKTSTIDVPEGTKWIQMENSSVTIPTPGPAHAI